jgi:hypothetical protein
MHQDCVPGRRYRSCSTGYEFEDGTTSQGATSAYGYCWGETDGSDDGACFGLPTQACSELATAATCLAEASCNWSNDACSGGRGCYTQFTSDLCGARTGCKWTPAQ